MAPLPAHARGAAERIGADAAEDGEQHLIGKDALDRREVAFILCLMGEGGESAAQKREQQHHSAATTHTRARAHTTLHGAAPKHAQWSSAQAPALAAHHPIMYLKLI
jgi:hypothetical protein